jgi:hypothetical protein
LSTSGVAVVPTPAAVLITSVAEAAGDSTTGVSGALVPNASYLEAFGDNPPRKIPYYCLNQSTLVIKQ